MKMNPESHAESQRVYSSVPFYHKPRALYAATFFWLSAVSGRYLAPFLEQECHLSATQIGLALGLRQLLSTVAGGYGGAVADQFERANPHSGRAIVFGWSAGLGTAIFFLHGLSRVFPLAVIDSAFWHVGLQSLFAIMTAAAFPVLDGITMDYLKRTNQETDYGKERLYGAVTWAVTHLVMSWGLDLWGFWIMYPLGALSTLMLITTTVLYTRGATSASLHGNFPHMQKLDSNIITQDDPVQDHATSGAPESGPHNLESANHPASLWTLLFNNFFVSPAVLSFLVCLVALSSGQAVVDSLVFLFFEWLESSYTMMGFTVVLTVLFEIPIFQVADDLLERFGTDGMLLIAVAGYSLRVVGYTCIPPGHIVYALVLEPLHGVTYACSQTASVHKAEELVPRGYEASGQGLISLFRGLGSAVGLVLGGWAEESWGPRRMYRVGVAVVTFGASALGCLVLNRNCNNTQMPIHAHQPVSQEDTDIELT